MKSKKGFTLLELLVAMAIIAVLLALAIFGILQVQKNSRETQRRKALEDINIGINDFYSRYGQYPGNISFDSATSKAVICTGLGQCTEKVEVDLKNSAKPSNTSTTTNQTEYYYNLRNDGYQLAFCREDGEPENGGTSPEKVQNGTELNCQD